MSERDRLRLIMVNVTGGGEEEGRQVYIRYPSTYILY